MIKTTKKQLRVDRREISFLKYVFEACDGLAVVIDGGYTAW